MEKRRCTKLNGSDKLGSLVFLKALSRRIGWGLLATGLLCGGSMRVDWSSAIAAPDPIPLKAFKSTGCSSVAVGVPYEDVGGISNAGQVHILESIHIGDTTTLVNSVPPFFNQDSEDSQYHPVEDSVENSDTFGYALAIGDFNADGYDDLAIGVPHESIGTANSAGAVEVLYGSSYALSAENDYLWHQGSPGMDGAVEDGDEFGYSLAVGDFDGDGYDDLAIGVPYEDVGDPVVGDAGLVQVMYGSTAGLDDLGNQIWDQSLSTIEGTAEPQELFGDSLAVGDFNEDGYDDLAIGVPYDNFAGFEDAGGVNVLYGSSPNGLTDSGDQLINQDTAGVRDSCGDWDHFGYALAAGDFNGDGKDDDLAVGVPGENADGLTDSGIVQELYGTFAGLVGADRPIWTLPSSQESAQFGKSMVVGDFDGNGYDDLAVGAPDLDIDTIADVGGVSVIYGTPVGLGSTGRQLWHQDNIRVAANEAGDQFGYSLAAGDFNCDLIDDLVVGIPYEDVGSVEDAGMLIELHGSRSGLTDSAARMWYQGDSGIGDATETSDHFAWALASIRIDWNKIFLPVTQKQE